MEDRLEKLKQKTLLLSTQDKEQKTLRVSRTSFQASNVYQDTRGDDI